ncbi:MAG: Site-specific recombinase XerD [bacterium]|nr:Site-specific recombinase XerD [bacterium]
MKRGRSSNRPRPAQLAIPLGGAAGAGARSGGMDRDAAPTEPPTIVAGELRFGPLDLAESVKQSTTSEPLLLDGSAAASSSSSSGELLDDLSKAVNDAGDVDELLAAAEDLAGDVDAAEGLDAGDAEILDAGENPLTALVVAAEAQLGQLADLALDIAAARQTPADALLSQLGPGSQKSMRLALDRIARIASGGIYDRNTFPWGRLRYPHALWIRNQLAATDAPKYVNKCLAAFRGVLREAFIMGQFGPDGGAEHYARALKIKNVKGTRRRRPRRLGLDEWRALFAACDDSHGGRRDAAFLTILRQGGPRCWEAAGADVADYEPNGRLFIARAKNDKQGTVYISNEGCEAIARWLEVRGAVPGPLLCPVDKDGRVRLVRVSAEALRRWWHRLRVAATLPHSWPHCARASFITDVAERHGVDVAQKLARHARLDQTGEYLVLDEERLRQASEGLHVPLKR